VVVRCVVLCCRAGLLSSTYLEVMEVQQLKESYDASLVSGLNDDVPLGRAGGVAAAAGIT